MVLGIPYFGNIAVYATAFKEQQFSFNPEEVYQKQTYRNRAQIQGANKVLDLSVPIEKPKGAKVKTKDIKIAYSDDWVSNHLRSIRSSYGKTPYFEHLYPYIEQIITQKPNYLLDLNLQCHNELMEFTSLDLPMVEKEGYPTELTLFKPSKRETFQHDTYFQAFSDRQPFTYNLSLMDYLFNEGPEVSVLFNSLTQKA